MNAPTCGLDCAEPFCLNEQCLCFNVSTCDGLLRMIQICFEVQMHLHFAIFYIWLLCHLLKSNLTCVPIICQVFPMYSRLCLCYEVRNRLCDKDCVIHGMFWLRRNNILEARGKQSSVVQKCYIDSKLSVCIVQRVKASRHIDCLVK